MIKYLLTSFLLLLMLDTKAQKQIVYRIVDDTVVICIDRPILKFSIGLTNHSGTNFLLYGFRNSALDSPNIDSSYVIKTYSESGSSNGLHLFFNGTRANIWQNIGSVHDENLTSAFEKGKNKMIETTLKALEVLNANSSKKVGMNIDLSDCGPLEKGSYCFYLIYSSGLLTKQILGSIVTENEAKYKGVTFNGYLVSNQATLVVK